MSNKSPKNDPLPQGEPGASAPDEFPMALEEFCSQLSQTDKRVELIGGFHHTEKVAGRLKDTHTAYHARFVSFLSQPA